MSVYASYQRVSYQQFSFFHFYLHVCDQLSGLVMESAAPLARAMAALMLALILSCAVCCVLWGKLKTPKYLGIDNA